MIVDASTSYKILLGWSSLNQLGAIVFTPHLAMKFPSSKGDVITVHIDQKTMRECYVASLQLESMKPEAEKSKKKAKGKEEMQSVNVTDLDLEWIMHK